jgi:hypothetical protein
VIFSIKEEGKFLSAGYILEIKKLPSLGQKFLKNLIRVLVFKRYFSAWI